MPENQTVSEEKPASSGSNGAAPSLHGATAAKARKDLGDEKIIAMYRQMLLLRRFEEVAGRQYQMGKIKGFCHLYIGQEPVAVGSMSGLEEKDYVVAAYREHGQAIAKGLDPNAVMAELFAKSTGCSKGKGGSMHLFDVEKRFYGGWGIVGGQIPTAAGVAFASKYRDEGAVVLCYFGDGSIHQGAFHEALNMAAKWDLPCVFITENNKYAMGTDIERISAILDIQQKAVSYGMDHAQIDGKDIFKAYYGFKEAIDRARNESRPTFLDVITYRFRGHSMSDPAKYRTKEELQDEMDHDPIKRMETWMLAEGVIDEDALKSMDKEIKDEVKAAVKFAEDSPFPDPSELTTDVYVEWNWDIE